MLKKIFSTKKKEILSFENFLILKFHYNNYCIFQHRTHTFETKKFIQIYRCTLYAKYKKKILTDKKEDMIMNFPMKDPNCSIGILIDRWTLVLCFRF